MLEHMRKTVHDRIRSQLAASTEALEDAHRQMLHNFANFNAGKVSIGAAVQTNCRIQRQMNSYLTLQLESQQASLDDWIKVLDLLLKEKASPEMRPENSHVTESERSGTPKMPFAPVAPETLEKTDKPKRGKRQ